MFGFRKKTPVEAPASGLYEAAKRIGGTFNIADEQGRLQMLEGMNAAFRELQRVDPQYKRYSSKERHKVGMELLANIEEVKDQPLPLRVGASAVAFWLISGALDGPDPKAAHALLESFLEQMAALEDMLINAGVLTAAN